MDASAAPVHAARQRAGMHQDSSLSICPGKLLWCISQALATGTLLNFQDRIIQGDLAKVVCVRNDLDKTETDLLKLGTKFVCSTLLSMKIQIFMSMSIEAQDDF